MNKPLTRGYLHLFLYFATIPVSIFYLYPLCENISHVLGMSLFTLSNLFYYGFSSLQHSNRMSRNSYKTLKTLVNISSIFSYYIHLFNLGLLVLKENLGLSLTMSFLAAYTLPNYIVKTYSEVEQYKESLIKGYLILVTFIHFIFYFQSSTSSIYLFWHTFFDILYKYIYVCQRPKRYYYDICHILSIFVYGFNVAYWREVLSM